MEEWNASSGTHNDFHFSFTALAPLYTPIAFSRPMDRARCARTFESASALAHCSTHAPRSDQNQMKVASQKQNPQDATDASQPPNISARVPLAAHIGGGRLSEVCSIVERRAPLFSSHLLQLFGRQGSPGSIASAIPLDNTMIRAVLSDGEDRGSGSTAQVASQHHA